MINEVSPEILQKLREIANNPGKCYRTRWSEYW